MNLYKTTAIVTVFTLLEHALGFVYRILLSRTLGPEGLGVYQVSLSVFAVFLTISSSGLPITLSRVISKHRAHGYRRGEQAATAGAVLITAVCSVSLTAALFLLRGPFSQVFSDPRCADVFYIVLCGLSFTSVYAVIRGSFWGHKRFLAYSLIELVEEIVMIVVGVVLLVFLHSEIADVNRAGIAVLVSYLASFTIAVCYFFIKGGRLRSPRGEIKPLLRSSVPITTMRTASSLVSSLVSVLFPMRLMAAGMSSAKAMSAYGVVGGMVMPILMIPNTLIGSIALVLVPELSERFYKGEREKLADLVKKALNTTLLIAGALIPVFLVCGEGVGILLFGNAESGRLIAGSAFLLLPMSLTLVSTSILNSVGCERQTLLFFLCGAAGMLLCVWFLPARLGSGALLAGMACESLITSVCSLCLLAKKTGKLRSGKYFLRLFGVCAVISLAGLALKGALVPVMDYTWAIVLDAAVVCGAEALCFHLFGLFDFKALLRKFFGRHPSPRPASRDAKRISENIL